MECRLHWLFGKTLTFTKAFSRISANVNFSEKPLNIGPLQPRIDPCSSHQASSWIKPLHGKVWSGRSKAPPNSFLRTMWSLLESITGNVQEPRAWHRWETYCDGVDWAEPTFCRVSCTSPRRNVEKKWILCYRSGICRKKTIIYLELLSIVISRKIGSSLPWSQMQTRNDWPRHHNASTWSINVES